MATRKNCFFFCSFFIFLCWTQGTKELNLKNLKDSPWCRDAVSRSRVICGEPAGDNCLEDSCYTFNTTANTWKESRKECQKIGGDLVSIETKEELAFLQKRLKELQLQSHREWYIGLSVDDSQWEWESGGEPLTIDHWHRHEIDQTRPNGDGEVGAIILNYPKGWFGSFEDIALTDYSGSICEIPKDASGKYCYKTSCYIFDGTPRRWEDNKRECMRKNGHLLSLETECEWKHIVTTARNKSKSAQEWQIGLRRKPVTSWKWVSNTSYTLGKDVWKDHHPKGTTTYASMEVAASSRNPVKIFSDLDSPCDESGYICEKKIVYKPPEK